MMTAQDIREKGFEKAVFGGYDAAEVDSFLEEVSGDWSALQKENAVLKSKLKVLVEKIEEYRSTEDAMRMALLSAQKMASEITGEAREKSDQVISEAQESAEAIISKAKGDVRAEEQKLVDAKRSSVEFIEKMRLICTTQLDFLDALNSIKAEAARVPPASQSKKPEPALKETPAQEEYIGEEELASTVKSIEDSVTKLVDEPHLDILPDLETREEFEPAPGSEQPERAEDMMDETRHFDMGAEPESSADSGARPAFNFDNLRFGEDFDPGPEPKE